MSKHTKTRHTLSHAKQTMHSIHPTSLHIKKSVGRLVEGLQGPHPHHITFIRLIFYNGGLLKIENTNK